MGSSPPRREKGSVITFRVLAYNFRLLFTLIISSGNRVSARFLLYLSKEHCDAICPFAECFRVLSYLLLLCPFHVSGSSPLLPSHGSLFFTCVPVFRTWGGDVARRGRTHWRTPFTIMCWEKGHDEEIFWDQKSLLHIPNSPNISLKRPLHFRILLLNECIFHCFRNNFPKAFPWTLEPIITTPFF